MHGNILVTFWLCGHILVAVLLLLDGEDAAASELLEAQAEAVVHPQLAILRDYHRALIAHRQGDETLAIQLWSGMDHPWARYAVARVQRQAIATDETESEVALPARTLTAILALEQEDHAAARAVLESGPTFRSPALEAIAAAQEALYHPDALTPLAQVNDRDAQLWRAYGLLRLGRPEQAEAALRGLPEDDGMAALYRMYVAAAAEDHKRAVAQFRIAAASGQAPRAQLDRLSSFFFDVQGDRLLLEDFQWPTGERLPVGWFVQAQGSGITIRADGEHLVFTGEQRGDGKSISRAWRELPRQRLRAVSLRCQQEGGGYGGVELRDISGQYGLAVAFGSGRLAWRRLQAGQWLPWEYHQGLLPEQLQIWIDPGMSGVDQVRLLAAGTSIGLTSLLDLPGPVLALGTFVTADPGEQVHFVVDALEIRLRDAEQAPNSGP